MLDPLEQRSNVIDRDKRAIELAALAMLYPALAAARSNARAAVQIGADPVHAATVPIVGDDRHEGIGKYLVWAAVATSLPRWGSCDTRSERASSSV